jgi:hypothetical protein
MYRMAVNGYRRKDTVYRKNIKCILENGDILSDGLWICRGERDCVSDLSKWLVENGGNLSDGLCMCRGERSLYFGGQ